MPIGWAKTNSSLPPDPVSVSSPDTAKIGDAGYASTLSLTEALPVLPSALVQLSLTLSTIAPAKVVGAVTVSDDGSLVCTVQLPSPLLVPWFKVQSDGTPLTVTVVRAPIPDESFSARLIGLPAMPAGVT